MLSERAPLTGVVVMSDEVEAVETWDAADTARAGRLPSLGRRDLVEGVYAGEFVEEKDPELLVEANWSANGSDSDSLCRAGTTLPLVKCCG